VGQVRDYVQSIMQVMGNDTPLEHRVLSAHGVDMTPKKHPKRGTMTVGECYANAYALASNETPYRYCEGYATSKKLGIALAHAWVIDQDLKVIDPTWVDGDQYFGVVFRPLFVYKTVARTRHYGIFGNLYRLRMTPDSCESYLINGLQSIALTA